ncbi:unnamed protein product [Camellia sinensis]
MAELEVVAEEDAKLSRQSKPTINKLKKLPLLVEALSKKQLHHGVLTLLKTWLEPLPDGSLLNINIRGAILRILTDSGVGKVIMFLLKSDEEITANRRMTKDLVDKWMQKKVRVLWGIWIHRNKAVFQKDIEHLIRTIEWINHLELPSNRQLYAKLLGINSVQNKGDVSFIITNNASWCPDYIVHIFLIDGAWRQQSSQARATWVAMDYNGNPIIKKQFSLTASLALLAEAKACLEVLKWCSQHQIMSANILPDCQMLVLAKILFRPNQQ